MSTPPPRTADGYGADGYGSVTGQHAGGARTGGAMWAPVPSAVASPPTVPGATPGALSGSLGPSGPLGHPSGPPAPPAPAAPVRAPRRARGLLWAVGGAVVASAVWAAAVLTVPGLVTGKAPEPPGTAGYHVVDDLCATARLNRFTQLYPSQSGTPYHYTTRHRALDDMYCSQYRKKLGSDSEYYSLYLQVQLHKAGDPRPEFAAQRDALQQRRYQITAVPNLGDEAYIGYLDDPSRSDRTWHYLTHALYVRQGGVTYYASWSGSYQDGKTTAPDREEIRVALMADTRDLLKALGGAV